MKDQEMTFWDHLDELRKVLFRSLLGIMLMMVIVFINKTFVFEQVIFAPRSSDFMLYRWFNGMADYFRIPAMAVAPFEIPLQNIEMSAQFFTHMNVSFCLGFVLAAPYVFYQLWRFVSPALYENEKKAVKRAFGWSGMLFYIGVAVGYLCVFPLTIRFLGNYRVSDWVENRISLKSYIHMFTWLIIVMGLVFEMPVLARLLSRLGIVTKRLMKKYRRHAVVVLLILAALITPSGDPFTMMVVFAPLYLLYECSIAVCREAKTLPEG